MKKAALFDLYTDFLITSPNVVSALLMADMLQNAYSHDAITRMLAQDELDQSVFWKLIKPTLRQIETDEGIVSVDDTIQLKPHSEENELISWHYSHTDGTTVKGTNIVTFTYSTTYQQQKVNLPVAFELVRKDKWVERTTKQDGKFITRQVRQASVSKLALVRQRLHTLVFQNQVRFKYVTFDTWYADSELISDIVTTLKKHCVCALKANRSITFEGDKPPKQRTYLAISDASLEPDVAYRVHLKGLALPVLIVKRVFHHLDGSSSVQYLLSTDLGHTGADLIRLYGQRWSSEEVHRSLKQNTALERMPAKKESSQANHILASMVALVKLEALKIASKINQYRLKRNLLIKALQSAWEQIAQLKQLCLTQNISLPNFQPA